MNESDQTTQIRSSSLSGSFSCSSPLEEKLLLLDTCLKLVKSPSQTKFAEGLANELPSLVGLECRQVGAVYLPFSGNHGDRLIDAYKSTQVQSNNSRYTFIDPSEILFKNPLWDVGLKNLVQRVSGFFECKLMVEAKLKRLIALKKGDRIEKSCLGFKLPISFGTMFIELASNYTGGEIVAYDKDSLMNSETDFRKKERQNEYGIYMTTLSNDLEYEIRPVESGHRLILEYSLNWCIDRQVLLNGGDTISIDNALSECLSYFSKEPISLAMMLEDDYEGEQIENEGFKALTGWLIWAMGF